MRSLSPHFKIAKLKRSILCGVLMGVAAGFGSTNYAVGAETKISVLDWATADVGVIPYNEFATGFIQTNNVICSVVDAETDPPSPFVGEKSLFAVGDPSVRGARTFVVQAKPFNLDPAPAQGWLEFQMYLNSNVTLSLGTDGSQAAAVTKDTPYDGVICAAFRFSKKGETAVFTQRDNKEHKKIGFGVVIPPESPVTLRILWVSYPGGMDFFFQIDGIDVVKPNGEPVSLQVTHSGNGSGIDYFRIAHRAAAETPESMDGGLFLGKITAGSK